MANNIFSFVIIVSFLILSLSMSEAGVTGLCSDCHVMHASDQRNVYGRGAGVSTPYDNLLITDCLSCHTGDNNTGSTPYVYTTGMTETEYLNKGTVGTALAGGNFKFADDNDRYGHNPNELTNLDSLTQPPGWISGFDANGQVGTAWGADTLTCAGTYGCHGLHSSSGINGTHHNDASGSITAPTTVGNSYRFLYKIKGFEDDDYEFETTDHNIYYAVARSGPETTIDVTPPTDTNTISYFCSECHGVFHSGTSNSDGIMADGDISGNPWIRHPIDVEMDYVGDNSIEYDGYVSYNLAAPVGSSSVVDQALTVTSPGDRIIMCLSCHVAHASPYYAALRWDYRGDRGAWVNGCAYCHTSKD